MSEQKYKLKNHVAINPDILPSGKHELPKIFTEKEFFDYLKETGNLIPVKTEKVLKWEHFNVYINHVVGIHTNNYYKYLWNGNTYTIDCDTVQALIISGAIIESEEVV